MSAFAAALHTAARIAPLPVAAWMARGNAHYYATRDPFGVAGDFVTAPEISQIFGELIGAWLVDQWRRLGAPAAALLVELGPGRGTLMADIRRVAAAAGWTPATVFVETSPVLAAAQARAVPDATVVASLDAVPRGVPLLLVANEFFDALPIRQFVRAGGGWHERVVGWADGRFAAGLDPVDVTAFIPPPLAAAPPGSVVEVSPAATATAAEIGARLRDDGGAALIVDYGHAGPVTGDTLQAVRGHAAADPFADPGEIDLTAHVDFTALAAASGVAPWGPVGQGDFLRTLGIDARAAALTHANPAAAGTIAAAVVRLTGEAAMGRLFKVMALTRRDAPQPAGFA